MQACTRCNQRKVRCDKRNPCGRCELSGLECTFNDRQRERLYTKHHVDNLASKVRRLENTNEALEQEIVCLKQTRTQAQAQAQAQARSPATASSLISPVPNSASYSGDVTKEVSSMAINASGERHYLGSSSGLLLADFVRANVNVPESTQQPQYLRPSSATDDVSVPITPGSGQAEQAQANIPPVQLARRLVLAYLNHDHICYPIIHPAFLWSVFNRAYEDPPAPSDDNGPFESFVLNIVMAISTTHVLTFDWQILQSAESHHIRALSSLPAILQQGDLRSLQALLLLTQYRMSSSVQENSTSAWLLVGMASRLAIQFGLHREDTYSRNPSSISDNPHERAALIDQELSRNSFWCTIATDRIVSNMLGRPLSIQVQDIDTQLPAVDNDSIMALNLDDIPGKSLRDFSGSTAIFVHIIRYRLLCGKLVTELHGQPGVPTQMDNILARRVELSQELDIWREQIGILQLPLEIPNLSCYRSRVWFEALYHNAILLLYRPSHKLDISSDRLALQNIFLSAKESITLYAKLHALRQLNYSWTTLQTVFMSGLSYIFAASMHFRARQSTVLTTSSEAAQDHGPLRSDPTILEVVNVTRACSNVLIAVSARWMSLRNCSDVFNRLSDAVLTEIVNFGSDSRGGPGSHAQDEVSQQGPEQRSTETEQMDGMEPHEAQTQSQNFLSAASWNYIMAAPPQQHTDATMASLSRSTVDQEFRHTLNDLQVLYEQDHVDYSVSQLSQAWYDIFDF